MASLLRGWERYSFAGPEPIAVAIDPYTGRCEVLEGEAVKDLTQQSVLHALFLLPIQEFLLRYPLQSSWSFLEIYGKNNEVKTSYVRSRQGT